MLVNPLLTSVRSLERTLRSRFDPAQKIVSINYNHSDSIIHVGVSNEYVELPDDISGEWELEDKILSYPVKDVQSVGQMIKILQQLGKRLFTARIKNNFDTAKLIKCDDYITFELNRGKDTSISKQISTTVESVKRLMLIDFSNLLTKGYYATLKQGTMQTSDGRYTNAVYAMVQSFFKLLDTYNPTHVIFCKDESRSKTWRRNMYPHYKGERDQTPPELEEQFDTASELLNKMNVLQKRIPGYEADDIIASLTKRAINDNPNSEVIIVSSDKDLYQLLDTRVYQVASHRGQIIEFKKDDFIKKYGIEPSRWVDAKALIGESGKSSDQIPGCEGVGEQGALKMIQTYGSLKNIYGHLPNLDKPFKRYVSKLEAGRDNVKLSYRLVRLITDLDVVKDWDEARIKMSKKNTVEAFKSLEFKSLLQQIS